MALLSEYADPSQINLRLLFYMGFSDESWELTDVEREELQGKVTLELDVRRLPAEKINQVLIQHFGITLEEVDVSGFAGLTYLESTNCYYFATGDADFLGNFKAIQLENMEDGKVRLSYTSDRSSDTAFVAVLKLVDGNWQILSNQRAQ